MKSKLSNVKQQFQLPAEVDQFLNELADDLNKKPSEIRKEILCSYLGMKKEMYYISLGQNQQTANQSARKSA